MSNFRGMFTGKVCVVTGGTQGVGAATARLLAERGAEAVAICGRNGVEGERMAAELTGRGCKSTFVSADLSGPDACFRVIDRAIAEFGGVDVLANVAGITDRGTIQDTLPATFDRLFAVNTRAPFFLMQRAIPSMCTRGGGAIVNVLSIAIYGGAPFITAYVGSKAALAGITKNVAHAVRFHRIKVNGLNMGWTATPGEHQIQTKVHGLPEDWLDEVDASRPFGRLLRPEDVARGIAFLASEESGFMTGAIVDYDQTVIGAYD